MLMDPQPEQLVLAARAGDRAAAGELISRYYARIYALLRRLAGDDSDAADLTQRAFARIWQALPAFAGRATVASWMHSIAYRTYVDWLRSNHRAEPRSDEWWEACPAPDPSPADRAAASDLAATLFRAVDALEPAARSTVHLHYYQGLSLEETADALGIAVSTVKYRLRQALEALGARIRDHQHPLPRLNPQRQP